MFRLVLFRRPLAALRLAALGLSLMPLSVPAHATVMRYLEIEELTRLATNVIHGEVLSTKVYWDDSHTRILTAVRVRLAETFKGALKTGEIITITQAGGELDGLRQDYFGRPVFNVGETVVLFTKTGRQNDHLVIGLKQGKLRVVGSEALRDFSGITLLEPGTSVGKAQPARVQMRLPLSELRQRIANTR